MRHLLLIAFVSIVTGCTSAKFLPYSGNQTDWPTSPGAFAETIDGIEVFNGLPPKPYDVLGQLELERKTWLSPNTRQKAATVAKERGGDAVIMLEEGTRFLGYSSSSRGNFTPSGNSVHYSGSGNSRAQYAQTARVFIIRYRK